MEASIEVFTHLLSLPRDELYKRRDALHPWLNEHLSNHLHQVGEFVAHTVANVAALCLGPNELVAVCSHVSIATSTKTWTRVKDRLGIFDKDHEEANNNLLPAISFMTGEPYHSGEEGICQWGRALSKKKRNFRTTHPGGSILTRATRDDRSPGKLRLVHVSAEGVLGPHQFLSMEFPRIRTSLSDPYWQRGSKKISKKSNGSKGIKVDQADFPLLVSNGPLLITTTDSFPCDKSLPVPSQVQILLKADDHKPFISMHGLIVDGLMDNEKVIRQKMERKNYLQCIHGCWPIISTWRQPERGGVGTGGLLPPQGRKLC